MKVSDMIKKLSGLPRNCYFRHWSLRAKFIIAISIVLIITMGAGMAITILTTRKAQLKALQEKGKSMALLVSKMSIDPVLYKDTLKIDSIVTDACKDDEVLYAFVYDNQGKLLNTAIAGLDVDDKELKEIVGNVTISEEVLE